MQRCTWRAATINCRLLRLSRPTVWCIPRADLWALGLSLERILAEHGIEVRIPGKAPKFHRPYIENLPEFPALQKSSR